MTLRAASFGFSGHERQSHLPGTDIVRLPDRVGLLTNPPPHPDALSSQPFAPAGDGAESLLGGRVTAVTTGFGTADERTVFDVAGPWNSVKNAAAVADEAAHLAFLGFVHVDAAVGLASEESSALEVVGAKRGNLVSGRGADRIDVRVAGNGADWSNEFRVASGEGDDEVRFSVFDVEAAARAGDATFASAEATVFAPHRGGEPTAVRADLGAGADLFRAEALIQAEVRGGAGDDTVRGGAGAGDIASFDGAADGYEVLASDGDRAVAVRDIDPTNGDEGTDLLSGVERLRFADRTDELPPGPPSVVFRAPAGHVQYELWATDGTVAGTVPVRSFDEDAGYRYGQPYVWTPLGDGRALVAFGDPFTAMELWATDGTAAGTSLVKRAERDFDIIDGQAYGPVALGGGRALFATGSAVGGLDIWITDGTGGGTVPVKRFDPADGHRHPAGLAPLDEGRALFAVRDNAGAVELWATDGTAGGASLVKAIEPGATTYERELLQGLAPLGDGRALFGAGGDAKGRELWVTDGTAGGTAMVEDINPGMGDSFPYAWAPLGDGRALFSAAEPAGGRELWITDGTAEGTSMVKDIEPGGGWGDPRTIFALGDGRALFTADDGAIGRELWITDGTAAGTSLVEDIRPGRASSHIYSFTALDDGRVLFAADDGAHGREPWITDGTAAGTALLADIAPGEMEGWPFGFTVLDDGRALFVADQLGLWTTDGTAAGTWPLPKTGLPGGYGWAFNAAPLSGGALGADPFG